MKAMVEAMVMVKAMVTRTLHRIGNRTDPDTMLNMGLDCVQVIWKVQNNSQAKIP